MNSSTRDKVIKYLLLSTSLISIVIVVLIFTFLFREALPFLWETGFGKLLNNDWVPVSFQNETYGILPLITGSLVVTFFATIIAIPFGILGAVYISEIATNSEREFLKPFIEILAGIPSVVLGFFGLLVLAPFIKDLFGLNSGMTALTGAVLLALMAIPTIISISEDAIKSVPESYKAASLALGATRWQTIWKVTVPAALSGIVASVMLGMGRVIGETMAVMMVTGNSIVTSFNPFSSVRTLTATIAAEMGEVAIGTPHYRALFWVGLVLLLATFILNMISYMFLRKYGIHENKQ